MNLRARSITHSMILGSLPYQDGVVVLSQWIRPYKILFGEYKAKKYSWEVFECLRRVVLICVVAISHQTSPVVRAFCGLCIRSTCRAVPRH